MTSILEGLVLDGLDLNSTGATTRPWSPITDMPNIVAWFSAQTIVGNDGDTIAGTDTWTDRIAGYTTTQATSTKRPILKKNIVNGKQIVRFDGVDDFLTTNMGALGATVTVVAVSTVNSVGGRLAAGGDDALRVGSLGATNMDAFGGSSVSWVVGAGGTFAIHTWKLNGATSIARRNGTDSSTGNLNVGAGSWAASTVIGTDSTGTQAFGGDLAELVFISGTPSSTDLQNLEGYFAQGAQYNLGFGSVPAAIAVGGSSLRLQGYDVTPPPKRQEWAQGADIDGALLVRDPLFDNREITLRLRVSQQATMDLALAQIATLSKKLEEAEQQADGLALVWTPAGSANSITFYVLSGTVEGLPIDLTGDDAGWFLRAPVITVKLICKTAGYGTPITSSTTSSATPFVTATIASVPGDLPAEGRLLITDAATQSRRYVEWGLEWRYYDSTTSLLVDSDDMVTTGFSGTQTTRTGAYDPNAAGNNVIRSTLYEVTTAVCGTGNLGHVGTFRVKARIYASVTNVKVRLSWQEGDGPYRSNSWTTPAAVGFNEVDLGLVTIPPKQLGTQRWQARIEAYTTGTAGTDTIDVDYLVLVPAGQGYGKVRGAYSYSPGSVVGRDPFTGIASGTALNTRVAPAGGTWATSGAATDIAASDNGFATGSEEETRSTTADAAGGRFAILGATNYTDTEVSLNLGASFSIVYATGVSQSAIVRWVDASNYAFAEVRGINSTLTASFAIGVVVAGVVTTLQSSFINLPGSLPERVLRVTCFASGRILASIFDTGGALQTVALEGNHTALAAAGALVTGKPGFRDANTSAQAATRRYRNFVHSVPAAEQIALYSGRTAEIRYDGAIRQDSTGTYYGPVPAYRGSRFLVPPAGDENRTSRILVKAHRNDIEAAASDNVTDNLTIQTIITPRYLVVPF